MPNPRGIFIGILYDHFNASDIMDLYIDTKSGDEPGLVNSSLEGQQQQQQWTQHTDLSSVANKVDRIFELLIDLLKADKLLWLEAKTWLVSMIAALSNVSPGARAACISPLLPISSSYSKQSVSNTGTNIGAELVQLVCSERCQEVAEVIADWPDRLAGFFADDAGMTTAFFDGFGAATTAQLEAGARALALYALAEREDVWELLVWEGSHSRAPVTVAAQPRYFAELAVVPTIQAFARHCPRFWRSPQLRAALTAGPVGSVGSSSHAVFLRFQKILHEMLQDGGAGAHAVVELFEQYVKYTADWRLLCQRILPWLAEHQLLSWVNQLARQQVLPFSCAAQVTSSAPNLQNLVLADVQWDSLSDVLACNALATARPQLDKLLADATFEVAEDVASGAMRDADSAKQEQLLAELRQQVQELHDGTPAAGQVHRQLLQSLRPRSRSHGVTSRLRLLTEAWTLRIRLLSTGVPTAGPAWFARSTHANTPPADSARNENCSSSRWESCGSGGRPWVGDFTRLLHVLRATNQRHKIPLESLGLLAMQQAMCSDSLHAAAQPPTANVAAHGSPASRCMEIGTKLAAGDAVTSRKFTYELLPEEADKTQHHLRHKEKQKKKRKKRKGHEQSKGGSSQSNSHHHRRNSSKRSRKRHSSSRSGGGVTSSSSSSSSDSSIQGSSSSSDEGGIRFKRSRRARPTDDRTPLHMHGQIGACSDVVASRSHAVEGLVCAADVQSVAEAVQATDHLVAMAASVWLRSTHDS